MVITKTFKFEASHRLEHHLGKCNRLHGHSWVFTVGFIGSMNRIKSDSSFNMVIDYGDIKKIVKPLIENKLDHYHLNETLETNSPTSEFVANYIFEYIYNELINDEKEYFDVKLLYVEVKETCSSSCIRYNGDYDMKEFRKLN